MTITKSFLAFLMDTLETIVFVGSLYIVIYLFLFWPSQVKGQSMEPSFHNDDRIISSKINLKLQGIHRGDVVVVRSPTNPDIELIKRVIGLSNDTIEIKNGEVYINGKLLPEQFVSAKTNVWEGSFMQEGQQYVVPKDYIFIMGDNRPHSSDSRIFGPVSLSSVEGIVVYRYFPPQSLGTISNPFNKK